jgi:hypothetical protein
VLENVRFFHTTYNVYNRRSGREGESNPDARAARQGQLYMYGNIRGLDSLLIYLSLTDQAITDYEVMIKP